MYVGPAGAGVFGTERSLCSIDRVTQLTARDLRLGLLGSRGGVDVIKVVGVALAVKWDAGQLVHLLCRMWGRSGKALLHVRMAATRQVCGRRGWLGKRWTSCVATQ